MSIPLILALSTTTAFAAPSNPDAATFEIRGRVVDPSGAALQGASVVAELRGSGVTLTAHSGPEGRFDLLVPPGPYSVRVSAPGFLESAREIQASAGGSVSLDFALALAPRGEAVTVIGNSYGTAAISGGTRTLTPLRDLPQAVSVITRDLIRDRMMLSMGEAMRYAPGVQVHQGENNRDQVIMRGHASTADFFLDGVRDDVPYYRDLYNLDRIEVLKGPNALAFGRGGGGGVVNRVTKEAVFEPLRELSLQTGAFGHRRAAADFDQPLGGSAALRLNAMYETSGSFRHGVDLERHGVNPTLTLRGRDTRLTVGYERLRDARVADRGVTSFAGQPADVDPSTYYGNPADSRVRAAADLASASVEHARGRLIIRSRAAFARYDRFYQNYVPGASTADRAQVALTAYNNATGRTNAFSQTDFVLSPGKGRLGHTLLAGLELGDQSTRNFRNTGFFDDRSTSLLVPYRRPLTTIPVTFRQSATDADNRVKARVGAAYVQDQFKLSPRLEILGGLRFDRFDLTHRNLRTAEVRRRTDLLTSPRAGLVFKPVRSLSLYGSYGVSWLPSAGDQFSSLNSVTETLKPEQFRNHEAGVKWEPRPGLSVTGAVYRLDRTNTRATDPNDPARVVQTGRQRSEGVEIGITGALSEAWQIAGGYSFQDARVTSATTAARLGARLAQTPDHSISLWNRYRFHPRLAAAVGLLYRADVYAAIDNSVTLPGYTRVDAAAFWSLGGSLRLQMNVENLFDRRFWDNADSNTNISPGAPRAVRFALHAGF